MQTTQRRVFPFDACSVLLFAVFSVGVVTASPAQMALVARTQPSFGSVATTAAALALIGNRFQPWDANQDGALVGKKSEPGHKF